MGEKIGTIVTVLLVGLCLSAGAAYAEDRHGSPTSSTEMQASEQTQKVDPDEAVQAYGGSPESGKALISLTEVVPGLTPVSDYRGDIWNRSTLVGDPGGKRQQLYNFGVTLDASVTQVVQGVAKGGADNGQMRYNGLLDYGVSFDTGKLGLWSGGLFVATAQTSWAKPLDSQPGSISPVNFTAMYPVPFDNDTVLMEYYWTQVFPKEISVVVGRVNATNFLDRNRFANDPHNQFLNVSLNNDLLFGEFFQFSTYATLLSVPLTKDFIVGGAAWTPKTAVGDGDYGGDWTEWGAAGFVDYSWNLAHELGGNTSLYFLFSSADTADIDNPALLEELITGNVKEKSNNWMIAFKAEQYVWKPDKSASNQVRTRAFDFQEPGVGLFFRFGYTPKDRNLWNMSTSGGVGARGVIPGRPYDRMGVGFYTLTESDDLAKQPLIDRQVSTELGLEAYYNFAITPWAQLSADIQWIDSGLTANDDVVVLGTRLFTQF